MRIKDFKVEYQNGQMFIVEKNPAFSWRMESEEQKVVQTAWKIQVKELTGEKRTIWDTGVVSGSDSLYQVYEGDVLLPESCYHASLSIWDNKGNQAEDELKFETVWYPEGGFSGKWITYPGEEMDACPIFIKRVSFSKKVIKARILASACGIYKVHLNDERVGQDLLTPGWTEYHDRILYQTYDVTELLNGEEEVIEMTVAKGWYSGIYNFFCTPHIYGEKSAAFLELHVWYEDGTKEIIGTDASWTYTTGEDRYAEIYHGQVIDCSHVREPEKSVEVLDKSTDILTPQECLPVRIMEYKKPVAEIMTPKGEYVLDFGQNMAGIIKARLHLKPGQKVTIRHGETLDENGNFYTANLRQARATDTFIGSGKEEVFLPEFTYHGFRYICIEGLEEIHAEDITACVLYSEMEELCEFTSSEPALNRLYQNIIWGQKGNFVDIPTDCPQRDERLGWTGDAGVFSKTAMINMDTALFFRKWLKDLEIGQKDTGNVPSVVPNILGDTVSGGAVWGDCVTMITWNLYRIYGDERILKDRYQSMKAWIEFLRRRSGDTNLILTGFQYGDWLALDKEGCIDGNSGGTNEMLIASIFYAVSVKIVADSASVIGNRVDAEEYHTLFEKIKAAIVHEFMTPAGRIVSDTETAYVLMFWFDLIPEAYQGVMKELFIKNLDKHKNKLSTGFAGTPFLCYALHKIERTDLAGRILLTRECPGWLYAVEKGATTIWERWDSVKPDGHMEDNGMNSLNHYAYGSIGSWMVEILGGITAAEPGYKKIRIAPYPIKGLTHVQVRQKTPYGTVVSEWNWDHYHMTVKIEIPANTHAEVILPGQDKVIEVGSGHYQYEYDTEMNLKEERYHINMTLEMLFQDEKACGVMEQVMPGLSEDSNLHTISNFTVKQAMAMSEEYKAVFQQVIEEMNK